MCLFCSHIQVILFKMLGLYIEINNWTELSFETNLAHYSPELEVSYKVNMLQ